jgi:hypothetical protein
VILYACIIHTELLKYAQLNKNCTIPVLVYLFQRGSCRSGSTCFGRHHENAVRAKHRKSPQKVDENDEKNILKKVETREKISDARKNFRREKKCSTREKISDARKNVRREKKVEKYEIQAQYFNGTNTAPYLHVP